MGTRELSEAGFATEQQVRDAVEYRSVPLEQRIKNCAEENHAYIRRFFDYADPDKPGLTVRTSVTQQYHPDEKPREFQEIVWCDDQRAVMGRSTIFFNELQKNWSLNTIAVEQHLPKDLRREIANTIYDILFERDWIQFPRTAISHSATKSMWRQYSQRLSKLEESVVREIVGKVQ